MIWRAFVNYIQPEMFASPRGLGWLIHRLVACLLLIAWWSLAKEIFILIGHNGLYPIAELMPQIIASDLGFWDFPSHFWIPNSTEHIATVLYLGMGMAGLAFLGVLPRINLLFSTLLYLSYCVACRDMLSFQWDNLMLEMGMLAVFTASHKPATWAIWMHRVLLWKLMFQSGVAKWQSHIRDWQDGSAMTFYYETAPIPTSLGWYAHHLPDVWHHFESWWTLFFELVVPFFIFIGPKGRYLAGAIFGVFLVVDFLTANYGFFVLQAAVLVAVLVLDNQTVARIFGGQAPDANKVAITTTSIRRMAATLLRHTTIFLVILYMVISFAGGVSRFTSYDIFPSLRTAIRPFRVINTYHLFGHITRQRHEVNFEVKVDDEGWRELAMKYKPGPVDRAPPFVAPMQPRVDFRLWFYGLSAQRKGRPPRYVSRLLYLLCHQPSRIQALFSTPLPDSPLLVRVRIDSYQFTQPGQPSWWKRTFVGYGPSRQCSQ